MMALAYPVFSLVIPLRCDYRQVSNISHTLASNKFVDHSDVVGASPVGRRCPNCIFFLDLTPGFIGLGKDNFKTRQGTFKFDDLVRIVLKMLW